MVVAKFVGVVPHVVVVEPGENALFSLMRRFTGLVTGMAFAPDGSAALVLTYSVPLLFPRKPGESWPDALARSPVRLTPHGLPQAEGACFSADGRSIYIVSETLPQLLRYERK